MGNLWDAESVNKMDKTMSRTCTVEGSSPLGPECGGIYSPLPKDIQYIILSHVSFENYNTCLRCACVRACVRAEGEGRDGGFMSSSDNMGVQMKCHTH